jgi:hypothetical protein
VAQVLTFVVLAVFVLAVADYIRAFLEGRAAQRRLEHPESPDQGCGPLDGSEKGKLVTGASSSTSSGSP